MNPDTQKNSYSQLTKVFVRPIGGYILYKMLRKMGGPKWGCYLGTLVVVKLDEISNPVDQKALEAETERFAEWIADRIF